MPKKTTVALLSLLLAGCGSTSSSSSSPVATNRATSSSSSSPVTTSSATTTTSSTATRNEPHRAAALLHADDHKYLGIFEQGVSVILNRGQPNSFPAFHAWFQKYGSLAADNTGQDASYLLKAGDSPALQAWSNQDLAADIDMMAMDGLDVGGPSDSTARAKVLADARKFRADFGATETAAEHVAAGK